jgi:hypothetical protein
MIIHSHVTCALLKTLMQLFRQVYIIILSLMMFTFSVGLNLTGNPEDQQVEKGI